jgi:hypothetical protein
LAARFFDCGLRSIEEYQKEVECADLNPEGAGSVEHAKDSERSGAHDYAGGPSTAASANGISEVGRELLPVDQ